ncbi:exodeoxyribonuclease VII large subunit [Zhihengliuella flava]|uniref:Exodeoxyribonuclease 7 large subunit n=1 Tax=Zhihengliuella flava TaxID=1285193 RepID=A0A931DES3_9MICC|nr:exodeoxyribonuclease VII large subunit [Zhihengliuella flava]MBG6085500.1 exodeoxyribonuclease VII large subunit [Zhihengliuella flava]
MEQPAPTEAPQAMAATAGETSPENPWPLKHFAQILKQHIERAPETWIEGQLLEANVRNGHAYLTMRDVDVENSLSVTVWRSTLSRLEAKPEVGSRVVARVKPNLWLKTGRLSMNASDVRPVGLGDLLARLERLRQALGEEGLFDPELKRALPLLPERIGLITGRDSDAEKDVLRNATLRWPGVEFEVRNTAVQGVNAVAEVMAALAELDADPRVDVIVIARGGGALEDLLPFSSEELVRAVAAASTPVVSAIGHEADRPILDDVADLRASTPTDAAKRIVPDVAEERLGIEQARRRLDRSVEQLVARESERIAALRSRPVLAAPDSMIRERAEDIERLAVRSDAAAQAAVNRADAEISHLRARVRTLSPQHTLDRGYAIVQVSADGAREASAPVARDASDLAAGDQLLIRLARGSLDASVTGTHASNSNPR